MNRKSIIPLFTAATLAIGLASCTSSKENNSSTENQNQNQNQNQNAKNPEKKNIVEPAAPPKMAVAILRPTKGNDVSGTITLTQEEDGVRIKGEVRKLKPGKHGFHIHQYGDLRDPEGKSAGGHFNPANVPHGGPDDAKHHAGDFGNIEANEDGVAQVDIKADWLKVHFVIGRAFVVHAGADDLKSQPSGDAGGRVALGVIGIAQSSSTDK